jgi:hypothetical protein
MPQILEQFEHLARFLIVVLGFDASAQGLGTLAVAGAVGLAAVALLAATLNHVAVAATFGGLRGPRMRLEHARAPEPRPQSAPDTPGKPRPRAPGRVLAVATS